MFKIEFPIMKLHYPRLMEKYFAVPNHTYESMRTCARTHTHRDTFNHVFMYIKMEEGQNLTFGG